LTISAENQPQKHERIWDPLVRFFHWSLVAAFATAWWGRGESWIHEGAGKIVLALIIFRAAWGIIGPGAVRFTNFVRGPFATLRYLGSILRGNPVHHAGHNPAGAAMIGMMLLTLAMTTVSGVLMTTTALWGSAWLEWTHGTSAYLMLLLIAGHLLGIFAASCQHHENLIWSMVTGWKRVPLTTEPYLGNLNLNLRSILAASLVVGLAVLTWSGSTKILNASGWRMHKILLSKLSEAGCEDASVSGPRIEVFPRVRFVYDLQLGSESKAQHQAVSLSDVLEKRPNIEVVMQASDCGATPNSVAAQQQIAEAKAIAQETIIQNQVYFGELASAQITARSFPHGPASAQTTNVLIPNNTAMPTPVVAAPQQTASTTAQNGTLLVHDFTPHVTLRAVSTKVEPDVVPLSPPQILPSARPVVQAALGTPPVKRNISGNISREVQNAALVERKKRLAPSKLWREGRVSAIKKLNRKKHGKRHPHTSISETSLAAPETHKHSDNSNESSGSGSGGNSGPGGGGNGNSGSGSGNSGSGSGNSGSGSGNSGSGGGGN
jgi:cytochrome b